MIFFTLNILCMIAMNISFYVYENYGLGFILLGVQAFCLIMQLITRGEV